MLPATSQRLDGLGALRDSLEGRYAIRSDGRRSAQLLFLAGAGPDVPLAALLPLDGDTLGRAEALIRFWRASLARPVPPDTRLTVQLRRRLRLMMQAADGRANGASYREIAIVLYGLARVSAEPWKTSSLRDKVIGLVEGGSRMIDGGYLRFLCHRRRP